MAEDEALKRAMQLQHIKQTVPAASRRAIMEAALSSQTVQKQRNFYSTLRFAWTTTGAVDPVVYSLAAGRRVAFSYGVGETDPAQSGFVSYGSMTELETNVQQKNDTGGAIVQIYGLSIQIGELSDADLVKQLFASAYADITLNGVDRYVLLGRLSRIPGAGGLYGVGETRVQTPGIQEVTGRTTALTNGIPDASNFLKLAEPLTWHPVGHNESRFGVRIDIPRALTHSTAVRPAIANYQAAYTPPSALNARGTYVDLIVNLHTIESMPRSTQQ
jgi:hypothetical protein